MEWIDVILGFVGGGGMVSLFTMPSLIRQKKAEAEGSVVDNLHRVIDGWEKLANERQDGNKELEEKIAENERRIDELNTRIDELYRINGEWRDRSNQQQEEITNLKVERATNEVKLCMVRGCEKRQPQSGY